MEVFSRNFLMIVNHACRLNMPGEVAANHHDLPIYSTVKKKQVECIAVIDAPSFKVVNITTE